MNGLLPPNRPTFPAAAESSPAQFSAADSGAAHALASERALFAAALDCGLPVALWRLPQANGGTQPGTEPGAGPCIEGLVSLGSTEAGHAVDFTQQTPGFVFAPFDRSAPALFLRDDVGLVCGGLFVNPHATGSADALLAAYERHLHGLSDLPVDWYAAPESAADRTSSQPEFEALVGDAIDFIHNAGISKVVVSRTAQVDLPANFHPVLLFGALCARYPHAFVSLVSAPGVGTWLGASPELLLGLDGDTLSTVSLAGTQKRNGVPVAQMRWGRKEAVEQEMVSAYIRGFFAGAGVEDVEEQGPQTFAAGGVVHLQTSFKVRRAEAERLRLANRVLTDLHPTSAVCGMPRREALAFIQAREGYDRAFYSGYLGPVHMGERSALYVNLRCMQLRRPADGTHCGSASLYVGAGITADSDPAAEWRETEMKAQTILDVLNAPAAAPASAAARERIDPMSAQ